MPPPRTIHVDTRQILASIRDIALAQLPEALALCKYSSDREAEAAAMASWVPRKLDRLAGKPLTASERKRHQQALRQMEADGLIWIDTIHVKLTPLGRQRLAETTELTLTPLGE